MLLTIPAGNTGGEFAAIYPPRALRRQGVAAWTKSTIYAILRNPVYTGTLVYAKTRGTEIGTKRGKVARPEAKRIIVDGAVAAIVPRDLWEAAQARNGPRRFAVGRPWHRPYLLSGTVVCGHCGKSFQAHKPTRHHE